MANTDLFSVFPWSQILEQVVHHPKLSQRCLAAVLCRSAYSAGLIKKNTGYKHLLTCSSRGYKHISPSLLTPPSHPASSTAPASRPTSSTRLRNLNQPSLQHGKLGHYGA
ncbi:hypothetical protein PGT21_005058 [Puccinia graminis f. sp. tritici]|uniref:Uncharacterized protein n=1 Tax=Puccinia graminis f. sp. tritici TaxID=56615 RepID=A0A5B0NBM7_PUCGR|nr:hypothetical protein PGT21_005058 [Puccinia graminis f. sp. tritici]KAA1129925.1 hypothetical protein PGTUg99_003862 [Puccinia graminis f. sp. tritici]